ncbi:MAG: PIN domain-containing protein, partial [Ktedonobacterales bacterium]
MPPLSVVLDTNVFVAAGFNPHSASARLVDAVKRGEIRMVWNDATRREIERIVRQIPPLRTH